MIIMSAANPDAWIQLLASFPKPPPGWVAEVEPKQLIVIFKHERSKMDSVPGTGRADHLQRQILVLPRVLLADTATTASDLPWVLLVV